MQTKILAQYLKAKIPSQEFKQHIHGSLQHGGSLICSGRYFHVSAGQFLHLLNEYINGRLHRFELTFILESIDEHPKFIIENPKALEIMFEVASKDLKKPLSMDFIKRMIYLP